MARLIIRAIFTVEGPVMTFVAYSEVMLLRSGDHPVLAGFLIVPVAMIVVLAWILTFMAIFDWPADE